jgi:methanogenic corrinoid protein MtbC1
MADNDDIILRDLNDDDLVEQMKDDLYDGMADEVFEGTQILLERGWDANNILSEALVEGMRIVGVDFRDGILFVPEVLQCANGRRWV